MEMSDFFGLEDLTIDGEPLGGWLDFGGFADGFADLCS